MRSSLPRHALIGALLLACGPAAADGAWRLDAEAWARPRSGRAVAAMQPVAELVRAWSEEGASGAIVIHYPGGEEGVLWAAELRDWLVALGVPSERIRPVAGGEPGGLRLELRQSGGA